MSLGDKALVVSLALAGFLLPALPLVEIGGVASNGYARVQMVPGLWMPALLPGLALLQSRRGPLARWLLLGGEALVAVGLMIVAQVELTFTFDTFRLLPAGMAMWPLHAAGLGAAVLLTARPAHGASGSLSLP